MLSLWALASPDYYLGSAAESGELFAYYEADKGEGRSPDPLLRHGRWLGNFASKLGLPQGSEIRKEDFEALYYGLDPRTGDPIRKDGKSAEQQKADAKTRFDLERDFEKKQKAYLESFRTLERMVASEAASANDPEKNGERMRKMSSAVKDSMRKNNSEVQSETAEEKFSSDAIAAQQKEVERRKEAAANARKELDSHRQKSQRPGTDMVFSAPKTVSMQWAALRAAGSSEAEAIESAHDRAVRETFEVMQREFVMTRRRDPETSRRVLEFVQGVAVAQWRHFDARPTKREDASEAEGIPQSLPDPQLHDHLNLFSPVEGADGEIYAAYTDYIRANIKALGAMYRARLSHELRQAGYATEMDDQKNGRFFKLAGISKEQQGRMSARRNEIEGKLAEGYSPRDATLASRQAKNSLTGSEMLAAWGNVFASLGVDPQRVKSASLSGSVGAEVRQKAQRDGLGLGATEAAIRREIEKRTPAPRTDEQIIEELLSMEAHFSLADIRQKLWEDAQFIDGLDIDLDQAVELRVRGLLQHADLLRVFDPNEPQKGGALEGMNRFGEPVFTSRKLRERENLLFGETVPALAQSSGYGVDKEEAMRIVREIEAKLTEQNGKAFKLRDFQLRAVLQAACGDGQLSIQIAGAGLGKTTSAQFTKEILAAKGRKFLGVAPTNKAASGLGRELGIEASSIDRLLLDLDSGKATLDRDTVVFVDEAGMTSFDLMEALLQRAQASGAKLILTGDPEQLPAVARGNVLRKLTEMETLANDPGALLYLGQGLGDWDYISRQRQDWAKQASAFFSKGFVAEGVREYERRGHVHTAITRGELIERIAKAYLEDPAAADKKAILGTTNDQVDSLNRLIRAKLKESGALQGSWTIRETGMEISIGDRLVFREKVKGKTDDGAVKNDFGTVERVRERADGSLDIAVRLDKTNADGSPMIVEINTAKHSDLGHAFALTVHKSQGMTMDSVIAAISSFISKELFYVMASRHRERLSLFMLEQEKGTILANAALAIDKRHANDLKAVAALPQSAQKRLAKSSIALAENIKLERTRYEDIVLSGAARIDAALAKAQAAWAAESVHNLLEKARKAASQGADIAARALSGKAIDDEGLALVEVASEALGVPVQIKRGDAARWASGLEWAGRDDRFIYARSEATGETLAFLAERQPPAMRAASETAPTIVSLLNSLAAKGAKLDAKARDTLLAAQGAWAKGPASVWSERDEMGRANVAIRLKKGAEHFSEIVSNLSEAGGKWSADRQAWLFPIGSAKAMEKLIAFGSSKGFAAEAPLDPARARIAEAWLSIERAKSGTTPDIADALALVEGPEDIVAHDEILAFGKALDLLDRVKTSRGGKEIEAREAKGLIVAQDDEALYLAIPNSTRLLSIAKEGFAKAGLEPPSEDIVGRRMAIRFGDDGAIFNAGIVREGPKTEAIAEAAPGVPENSSRTAGALYLSEESDLAALRRDLAFVCRERDKVHKAGEIEDGAMPIVRLEGYGGSRLSGLVLAASRETVFILHGDKVVAVSRSAPALSSLNDLDAAALVGWTHNFDIQAGRASKLRLPEESCRLVPSAAFAGKQVPMRVLRADDEHVWLADSQRRAVRLDRSNPQIAGIGHGVWAALAEGKTLIEVRFDGAGSLAAEPQNRGRSITEAHAIAYPKQGEPKNRLDWLTKFGLER
jgi:conjugative relaxase-like TrwC/TraI family protein